MPIKQNQDDCWSLLEWINESKADNAFLKLSPEGTVLYCLPIGISYCLGTPEVFMANDTGKL